MKEKSIVLNMMQGEPGDILEKGRYYAVKKQSNGLIHADYCNSSQEDAALKLTLTALDPHAEFIIHVQRQEPYKLRANAAGIFESLAGGKSILVPLGDGTVGYTRCVAA